MASSRSVFLLGVLVLAYGSYQHMQSSLRLSTNNSNSCFSLRSEKLPVENHHQREPQQVKDPAVLYNETLLDGRCALLWDWPMIHDGWKEMDTEGTEIRLEMNRSNTHRTAKGKISMSITTTTKSPTITIVIVKKTDALSTNVWHRFSAQFMAWVSFQVATKRYNAPLEVIYVLPCRYANDTIPQGWTDLGYTTCNADPVIADKKPHSWTVSAPTDGFLWDLAWDTSFSCGTSNLFRYWIHHYTRAKGVVLPRQVDHRSITNYLGCYISRRSTLQSGRPVRSVSNIEEVWGIMESVFRKVREIQVMGLSNTSEIVHMVRDCNTLFGVHGAGMLNTIFAQPNAVVVEALPWGNIPAYYRNINMLAGHRYIGIKSNFSMMAREVILNAKTLTEVLAPAIVLDE